MADKKYLVSIELFEKRKDGFYRVYGKSMTRQKTIKVIAKRLIFEGVNYFECHTIAKWCLDALLEGGKII